MIDSLTCSILRESLSALVATTITGISCHLKIHTFEYRLELVHVGGRLQPHGCLNHRDTPQSFPHLAFFLDTRAYP